MIQLTQREPSILLPWHNTLGTPMSRLLFASEGSALYSISHSYKKCSGFFLLSTQSEPKGVLEVPNQ